MNGSLIMGCLLQGLLNFGVYFSQSPKQISMMKADEEGGIEITLVRMTKWYLPLPIAK